MCSWQEDAKRLNRKQKEAKNSVQRRKRICAAVVAAAEHKRGFRAGYEPVLGCNASYINNIENGKALPSMKTFFAICDFLEIEPADFFDLENRNPQLICKIRRNLQELDETSFDVIDLLIQHLQE